MGQPRHRPSRLSAGFRDPPRRARSRSAAAARCPRRHANSILMRSGIPAPPGLPPPPVLSTPPEPPAMPGRRVGPLPCSPRALRRSARWRPLARLNLSNRRPPTRLRLPSRRLAPTLRTLQTVTLRSTAASRSPAILGSPHRRCPEWVRLPGARGAAIRGAG